MAIIKTFLLTSLFLLTLFLFGRFTGNVYADNPTGTPGCWIDKGPSYLVKDVPGTYHAIAYTTIGSMFLLGDISASAVPTSDSSKWAFINTWENMPIYPNQGDYRAFDISKTWTPSISGTYDVFCRTANASEPWLECRGGTSYAGAPPIYNCPMIESVKAVTVVNPPNCTIFNGPSSLIVGQPGAFSATVVSSTIPNMHVLGDIAVSAIQTSDSSKWVFVHDWESSNFNVATITKTWTPTAPGTYKVFCRAANASEPWAECRGGTGYASGSPVFDCIEPSSIKEVTVVAAPTPIPTPGVPGNFTVGCNAVNNIAPLSWTSSPNAGTGQVYEVQYNGHFWDTSGFSYDVPLDSNARVNASVSVRPVNTTSWAVGVINCPIPTPASCSVPGDLNNDQNVNSDDFDVWNNDFLKTVGVDDGSPAQVKCGSPVDLVMFNTWRNQWVRQ